MKNEVSRRTFVKSSVVGATAAAFTARSYAKIVGANDRIRIAQVGCGSRGQDAHLPGIHQHDQAQNVEITALVDPWTWSRDRAQALVKEWYGRPAAEFTRLDDLLAKGDVDAVMIASPDHLHALQLEAVAKAGKHVYAEKPLGKDLASTRKAVDAVKAAGIVCQVGTQLRSMGSMAGARAVVQAGTLGKISRVQQDRNAEKPYWLGYLGREVKREEVVWEEFRRGLPEAPFNPVHVSAWYGYRDYSDGPVPQWGSHFIDLVHYLTGAEFPSACVCLGGSYAEPDEHKFTAPDQVQVTWHYPGGIMVSYATNCLNGAGKSFRLFGDKGTLDLANWNAPEYSAEGAGKRDGSIRGKNPVQELETPDHFLNWLQCLRDGKTPMAPIEAGFQHAVACIMATMAMEAGKRAVYDRAKREIGFG